MKMKKLYLLATITAIAVTGCAKMQTLDVPTSEMKFKAYTNAATKATVATTDNLNAFSIYCYTTDGNLTGSTVDPTAYFGPKTVSIIAGTCSIADGPYYWIPGKTNSFFSYANGAGVSNWVAPYYDDASSSIVLPSFDYYVPDVVTNEDFLVASTINITETSDAGNVNSKFYHALTRVEFQVDLDYASDEDGLGTLIISSFKLKNIYKKGKFTYTPSLSGGVGEPFLPGVWDSSPSEIGDYTLVSDASPIVVDTDQATTGYIYILNPGLYSSPDDNSIMILPQTPPVAACIEVTYSVTNALDMVLFSGTRSVNLSDASALAQFDAGKHFVYQVSLPCSDEEIKFATLVEAWSSETTL